MNSKIDSFWETFNSSKCKTAMLILSGLVWVGFIACEIIGKPSPDLKDLSIMAAVYWGGRTSKAQENIMKLTRGKK